MTRPGVEDWPSSSVATDAVDAAARTAYQVMMGRRYPLGPPAGSRFQEWEELEPLERMSIANGVMGVVWSALKAIEDPRRAAWEIGHMSAVAGIAVEDNPYGGEC